MYVNWESSLPNWRHYIQSFYFVPRMIISMIVNITDKILPWLHTSLHRITEISRPRGISCHILLCARPVQKRGKITLFLLLCFLSDLLLHWHKNWVMQEEFETTEAFKCWHFKYLWCKLSTILLYALGRWSQTPAPSHTYVYWSKEGFVQVEQWVLGNGIVILKQKMKGTVYANVFCW